MSNWSNFRSALAGGVVAAMLLTAVPVVANVGDAILAGLTTTADKQTILKGSVPSTNLRIRNTNGDGSAAYFAVEPGNPPFKVSSGKKVKKLNADRLDSRSANELMRVDGASVDGAWEPNDDDLFLATIVEVPRPGWIMANANVAMLAKTGMNDAGTCRIVVEKGLSTWEYSHTGWAVSDGAGTVYDSCSPVALFEVEAGTYTVGLKFFDYNSLASAASSSVLTALYIPFDGSGNTP